LRAREVGGQQLLRVRIHFRTPFPGVRQKIQILDGVHGPERFEPMIYRLGKRKAVSSERVAQDSNAL
jgi:hypothetical protein